MTLAQIRALIAVVETGSFNRAAGALRITQSAVSHAIGALERELGAALLDRDRKGLAPTAIGQEVLSHAKEMLAREEYIRQHAAASKGSEAGRVRFGTFASVSARFLPNFLSWLHRRHPGLEIVLFEGSDEEVREWLSSRAVDVGVITLPSREFESVDLITDEMLVVLPAAHRLAHRDRVRIREIADEPFVMSKGGCEPLIRTMYSTANRTPRVRFEARDMATVLGMVREGLGVTTVPSLSLPETCPGLRTVPLDPPVKRRLALAVRAMGAAPPAVKRFVQEAQNWVAHRREAGTAAAYDRRRARRGAG